MDRPNRRQHLKMELRGAIVGQKIGGSSNKDIAQSLNVSVISLRKPI